MIFYYFCLIFGAIMLTFFLFDRCKTPSVKTVIKKSATSLFFIGASIAAYAITDDKINIKDFGLFVIAGLVFGMLGDIWLDLKYVSKDDEKIYTYAGFISFTIGHFFYITGIIKYFADFSRPLYIIIPVLIAIALAFCAVFGAKLMKLDYGKYKCVSIIYTSLLLSLFFILISFAFMFRFENKLLDLMGVGGLLFVISDFILSGTYFGVGKNRKVDVITNHISYYAAQFLIASALLFM